MRTTWCVRVCGVCYLFWWWDPWYVRGKRDNEEGDLNWAHPFPRVWGYKKGSDVTESDISEVRVYNYKTRRESIGRGEGGIHPYLGNIMVGNQWTGCQLQMKQLSLRIDWLKFETLKKIIDHSEGFYGICPKWTTNLWKIKTYNRLDLETLGFWPILPKDLLCTIHAWDGVSASNMTTASLSLSPSLPPPYFLP